MDKEVMIRINGMQFTDIGGQQEPVEVISPGKYYFKNGHHYLLFEDVEDNYNNKSENLMKFRDSYLEVTKKGSLNARLIFEKDKKTKSQYGTPFGMLNIGISTTAVNLKEKEDSIEVTANYALEINDAFIADCSISLTAQSKAADLGLTS